MTIRHIMPLAGVFLVALLSACGGGSYGGGTTSAAAVTSAASAASESTASVAQAATAATKSLPTVDTAAVQALLLPEQTLQIVDLGETGTKSVTGKIVGYKSTVYAVPAAAGQTLTVMMTTPSTSTYFNVRDVRDVNGAAVHRGEVDGEKATISVPASTTYLIDPYLVRAVARRGETANYTLTITRQ